MYYKYFGLSLYTRKTGILANTLFMHWSKFSVVTWWYIFRPQSVTPPNLAVLVMKFVHTFDRGVE